jgi:taurine dioxygenase
MRFSPLHPDFGVEVLDYDPCADRSSAAIEKLRAALDEHLMLLFRRDGAISPEQHLEIASWFGPPTEALSGGAVSTFHNERTVGAMRLPFHNDFTFTDAPLPHISLHALELPAGGTSTSFVSSAKSWDNLEPDLQAKLAPLTIRHQREPLTPDEPVMIGDHPIRFPHPRTGRPILLINEYQGKCIRELSPEESDRTLKDLFARMYVPDRIYTHRWRLYDFLIWDNLALQHARREEAAMSDGVRLLQRVAVGGVGHLELMERARRQQAEREKGLRA